MFDHTCYDRLSNLWFDVYTINALLDWLIMLYDHWFIKSMIWWLTNFDFKYLIMSILTNLPSSSLMKWVFRICVWWHWHDWFEKSSIDVFEKFDFKYFKSLVSLNKCAAQRFGSLQIPKKRKKNLTFWKILEAPLLLNHSWFNHAPVRMSFRCHHRQHVAYCVSNKEAVGMTSAEPKL